MHGGWPKCKHWYKKAERGLSDVILKYDSVKKMFTVVFTWPYQINFKCSETRRVPTIYTHHWFVVRLGVISLDGHHHLLFRFFARSGPCGRDCRRRAIALLFDRLNKKKIENLKGFKGKRSRQCDYYKRNQVVIETDLELKLNNDPSYYAEVTFQTYLWWISRNRNCSFGV